MTDSAATGSLHAARHPRLRLGGRAALLLLALLLLGAGTALLWRDPVLLSWLWGHGDGLARYEPTDLVVGGGGLPLAIADPLQRTIEASALQAAADYAELTDSHALLVFQDGALQFEKYWNGHGPDTKLDSSSMHATLSAMLVGWAIKNGAIRSVDEPIARFLPDWVGDARHQIRIRDLLQMTGGLARPEALGDPGNLARQIAYAAALDEAALMTPPAHRPATRFAYNDAETQLLGLVLEKATGKRYAQLLSEALWHPLGASDARLWLDRPGGVPRAHCCLAATARDWVRVGWMLAQGGALDGARILSSSWVEAMKVPSRLNPAFGFQLWLGGSPDPYAGYDPAAATAANDRPVSDRTVWATAGRRTAAPASKPQAKDATRPATVVPLARDLLQLGGRGGQRTYVVPSCRLVIVRMGPETRAWDDAALPNALLNGVRDRSCLATP